jgi:hypothetical protein
MFERQLAAVSSPRLVSSHFLTDDLPAIAKTLIDAAPAGGVENRQTLAGHMQRAVLGYLGAAALPSEFPDHVRQ